MKKKSKLVSIILNCYNGEKYLAQALASIQNQNYNNWELIFWDNHSKDNSKDILQSFKNKKFKYFRSKKHTTLYAARNLAIEKAQGDFISFIDADDLWEKDKLQLQIKYFNDENVAVVYGNLWIRKEELKKRKIYINYKFKEGYIYQNLIQDYNLAISSAIINREYLNNLKKIFNDKYNIIGDYDLFLRLAKKYKFKVIQKPIATYRIHANNFSILNKILFATELKDWLKKNKENLEVEQRKTIKKKILNLEFSHLKFSANFFKTFIFFTSSFTYLLNIKNVIILISPKFLLKKFIWFY